MKRKSKKLAAEQLASNSLTQDDNRGSFLGRLKGSVPVVVFMTILMYCLIANVPSAITPKPAVEKLQAPLLISSKLDFDCLLVPNVDVSLFN